METTAVIILCIVLSFFVCTFVIAAGILSSRISQTEKWSEEYEQIETTKPASPETPAQAVMSKEVMSDE